MTEMTLNTALEEYYHRREGRYSPATWRAHEQQLEKFRQWLTRRTTPYVLLGDVEDRDVSDYFKRIRAQGLAASSHNNYRQVVKMFFGFCVAEAWIKTDPSRHVDPMPVRKRVRLQLTAGELLAALEDASPRDRAGLAVGMNTALRAMDVMTLKVGDLALDADYLTVWIEKTSSEDLMPVTADLHSEMLRWLQHYGQVMQVPWMDLPNDWTLIPPAQWLAVDPNDPTGPGRIRYCPDRTLRHPEKIVHRALERLGHPTKGEGFHTLRRSTARVAHDLAAADQDVSTPAIRIAQALLGHKHQSTTEGYLGLTVERQARDDLLRGKSFLRRAADAAPGRAQPAVEPVLGVVAGDL